MQDTHRDGPSAITNPNSNQQHHSRRGNQQSKCTKAMDMHFHWLRNQEAQGQFRIYWQPGQTNLADYFTEHHPPAHNVNVRGKFLTRVKDLAGARRTKLQDRPKH